MTVGINNSKNLLPQIQIDQRGKWGHTMGLLEQIYKDAKGAFWAIVFFLIFWFFAFTGMSYWYFHEGRHFWGVLGVFIFLSVCFCFGARNWKWLSIFFIISILYTLRALVEFYSSTGAFK
jgi:hypothetical protein